MTRGYGLLENYLAKRRADLADSLIPDHLRNGRILDVGCDKDTFFLNRVKFKDKWGIDPPQGIVWRNGEVLVNRKLTDFKDNYFSVVTMLAVIEHMYPEQAESTLKEIARILKPAGRIIITTPCTWTDSLLRIMAKVRLVSPTEINDHKACYHTLGLSCMLRRAIYKEPYGFEQIRRGYFEFYLNGWLCATKRTFAKGQ